MNITKRIRRHTLVSFMSYACMVHCIVLPILAALIPAIGHVGGIEIELAILSSSIVCGAVIMYKGYLKHGHGHIAFIFCIGALSWLTHAFYHESGNLLLVIAIICTLISYIKNHRAIKHGVCCGGHDE